MARGEPEGLGGWLILVGLGVLLAPLRIGFLLLTVHLPIFADGIWESLTTPGTADYNPYWGPFLIGEIAINFLLIATWLVTAVFYFTKNRIFPYLFSGTMVFGLIFILVDAFAFKLVAPEMPVFDPETTRSLLQQLVGTIVWVPYMFLSRRVRNTFVN